MSKNTIDRLKKVFYHARLQGNTPGSALRLGFFEGKKKDPTCLIEIASQVGVGERKFDWDKKITFSLTDLELTGIQMVIQGVEPEISFFHDPSKIRGITNPGPAKRFAMKRTEVDGRKEGDPRVTMFQIYLSEGKDRNLAITLNRVEARILFKFADLVIAGMLIDPWEPTPQGGAANAGGSNWSDNTSGSGSGSDQGSAAPTSQDDMQNMLGGGGDSWATGDM